MNDDKRVRVVDEVFQRFSGYEAVVVYAKGIVNDVAAPWTEWMLREAEARQYARFSAEDLGEEPMLAAWRRAYSAFGSKPTKYYCSPEAMLRRVVKGQSIPSINPVVNLYNAVSLSSLVPIGGEDLDAVIGSPTLTVARGDESFVTWSKDGDAVEHPDAGEVIWMDDVGVTCRRWNWRQCRRTMITPTTYDAYFVLDRLVDVPDAVVLEAKGQLIEGLHRLGADAEIHVERVSAQSVATHCADFAIKPGDVSP